MLDAADYGLNGNGRSPFPAIKREDLLLAGRVGP